MRGLPFQFAVWVALLGIAGCGSRTPLPGGGHDDEAYTLTIVSGDNQLQDVTQPLDDRLVVQVTDSDGNPAAGVTVDWTQPADGEAFPATTVTDDAGRTTVEVTLPSVGGRYSVQAEHGEASVSFDISARPVVQDIDPPAQYVGSTIEIHGTGFSDDVSENAVSFGGTQGTVESASLDTLVVTVPDVDTVEVTASVDTVAATKGQPFGTLRARTAKPIADDSLGCTPSPSELSRGVALDASNRIYVVFECDVPMTGEDPPAVVISTDGGATFTEPVFVASDAAQISVAGGRAGEAVIAWEDGSIWVSSTQDGGATWSSPTEVITGGFGIDDASVELDGDNYYIAAHEQTEVHVAVSHDAGETWEMSQSFLTPTSVQAADVRVDPATGDVWLASTNDSGQIELQHSSNMGTSFNGQSVISDNTLHGDWTLTGGYLWTYGDTNGYVQRIALGNSSAETLSDNVETSNGGDPAIASDADGNVYIGGRNGGSDLYVQRLPAGQTTFEDALTLDANGQRPTLFALSGGLVLVVWADPSTVELKFESVLFSQ